MSRRSSLLARLLGIWLIFGLAATTAAYEFDTHQAMSSAAFRAGGLAPILEGYYGVRPGDEFRGPLPFSIWERRTAADWVAQGGRNDIRLEVRAISLDNCL